VDAGKVEALPFCFVWPVGGVARVAKAGWANTEVRGTIILL
jgi:hypothetical protein